MPLGVDGVDDDHEHAAHDRLAQRAREARGQRSEAEGRVRRLHRALGSSRHRTPVNGDRSTTAREDNALGLRGADRDRARLHEAAGAAEALDPVPRRSPPRSRGCSARSTTRSRRSIRWRRRVANINMDSWNVHGRTKDLTLDRLRRVRSRRLRARRRRRAGPRRARPTPSRRRASTTARITSTSRSRACRRSIPTSGVDYVGKPADYGKKVRDEWTRAALPHAARRGDAGLGPERRARGSEGALRRRLPRGAGGQVSRSGSRATSSGRSATRC